MSGLSKVLILLCLATTNVGAADQLNGPGGDQIRAIGLLNSAVGAQEGLDNEVTAIFSLTGTTDDGGGNDDVSFTIFDDFNVVGSSSVSVPVGQTQTFTRTINWQGTIGAGAPGVGLYLIDAPGTDQLAFIDPFFLDGELPLSLSKAAPATVAAGGQITYTISYGNPTAAPRANVVIRDSIPVGTTFVSATGGGTLIGNQVRWNIGALPANTVGQTVQFTVNLTFATATVVNQNYTITADGVAAVAGTPTITAVEAAPPIPSEPIATLSLPGFLALLAAICLIGLTALRRH
jgi:uncharacterized repeat protein (TIGR01451 family)